MSHDVLVLLHHELSDSDAAQVRTESKTQDEAVAYHLLISVGAVDDAGAAVPILGIAAADTFGSAAVARRAGAGQPDEDSADGDVGTMIERSVRRLKATGVEAVSFAVTHSETLAAARSLAESTGSREVVVVAPSDKFAGLALPEWQANARELLGVERVRVIEHQA